jgi:L-amino acid N-acyltransferase YncA
LHKSAASLQVRAAQAADGAALAELYNYYVRNTITTFETEPVLAADMAQRVQQVNAQDLPWLVGESAGRLVGYSCAVRWKSRSAYRHACESTIYLGQDCEGRGWGSHLYASLLDQLRERELHTVMGGIAQPNQASVALHEKLGFSKVAHFSEVGHKFQRWIDVAYWQLLL